MNEGAIIHGGSWRRGETSLHTPASFSPSSSFLVQLIHPKKERKRSLDNNKRMRILWMRDETMSFISERKNQLAWQRFFDLMKFPSQAEETNNEEKWEKNIESFSAIQFALRCFFSSAPKLEKNSICHRNFTLSRHNSFSIMNRANGVCKLRAYDTAGAVVKTSSTFWQLSV